MKVGLLIIFFLLLVAVPLTEFYTWYNCLIREESCNVRLPYDAILCIARFAILCYFGNITPLTMSGQS